MTAGMDRRSGFALIEILVVVALIALLAGAYYGFKGHGGREKTIPAKAIEKAESVECQTNLSQLRQFIQMEHDSNEAYPVRIDQGSMASISRCPVSGRPYLYDPQTGRVYCATPGHEKY